ncbi:hypothetical protein CN941_27560 [Bacillus cereus]|nr:hypothetical protein CN527_20840 [Bacillus cereus]PFA23335.1 hypothetical protein CN390_30295 [Bacillus cereus]PFE60903.1 hypothetical protein CN316_26425 [Bacillus cereus]PFL14997.1 hypothetical protein COJ07_27310 [Bacillus cereus]PGL30921.1 hypothetical protein CN930_25340 [Bacillus cereus]
MKYLSVKLHFEFYSSFLLTHSAIIDFLQSGPIMCPFLDWFYVQHHLILGHLHYPLSLFLQNIISIEMLILNILAAVFGHIKGDQSYHRFSLRGTDY